MVPAPASLCAKVDAVGLVYRGQPGDAVAQRDVLDLLTPDVPWTDPAPVPAEARYDLVVVDPIGRRGSATSSQ
jgi:hypothetical protein